MGTVLHLIESWGPGGAETVFLDIAEGVRKRGWRSLTAVPREGWVSRTLTDRGLDPIYTGGDGGGDVGHLIDLFRIIRQNDVDIMQTHLFGSALYGGMASTMARIPTVATFHGLWDAKGVSGLRRIKVPMVDRMCDRKVFVSEPLRDAYVEEVGMRARGTVVIENGIDMSRFRPGRHDGLRAELGIGEEGFLVGTVGNVRPAKNHRMLLEVASRLGRRGNGIHFVHVGERGGELFEQLVHERNQRDLTHVVHFMGFRDDVESVLRSFDAYVLTSESEGFSLTTLQAMASGLPVVATRCGGPEALIDHGRTGFLVERGDARGMADVLASLRRDEGLRASVGTNASNEARRRYSTDRMVDGYVRIYRDLLGLNGAHPVHGSR